jgi:CheY-like chemotaxis protein
MNLLVVDDHPANRKLLRIAFEAEGHAVLEAGNGSEALEILRREPLDAIISDVVMPEMDGFRLCREIRKLVEAVAGIPFVLYTASHPSPAERQLAEAVGVDCYLLKPAPAKAIFAAVREAQDKARNRSAVRVSEADEAHVLEQYSTVPACKLEQREGELPEALVNLDGAHQRTGELDPDVEAPVAPAVGRS